MWFSETEWWYLSFADTARPEGQQWLGGAYVRGVSFPHAVDEAWRLGINPGGEVKGIGPLSEEIMDANTAVADRERLLDEADLGEAMGWPNVV